MKGTECPPNQPTDTISEAGAAGVEGNAKRHTFDTGAQRNSDVKKGLPHLIPWSGLQRLARHYEYGVTDQGYARRNWEGGIPLWRYFDGIVRHAFQWLSGETDEDHMAAVAWNAFGIMHHEDAIAKGTLPVSLLEHMPNRVETEHVEPPQPGNTPADEKRYTAFQAWKAFHRGRRLGRYRVKPRDGPLAIYMAGPLSSADGDAGEDRNTEWILKVAKHVAMMGHYPHVPHTATLPLHREIRDHFRHTMPYGYWLKMDMDIIKNWADAVYRCPGDSVGADAEVDYAKKLGLPIFYDLADIPDESESLEDLAETREEFDRARRDKEVAAQTSPS
jgi:hypothetical protein